MYLLSIDGGATSAKAGIFNLEKEKLIKEYKAGSLNYINITEREHLQNLHRIVKQAKEDINKIDYVVMGIAGIDTKKELEKANKVYKKYFSKKTPDLEELMVFNDIELVLNNSEEPLEENIAIIAGTGSNSIGYNTKKEKVKAGGWDYKLSDQGSGYYIGRKAARAAVKSYDGRGAKTTLETSIFKTLHIENNDDLKNLVYNQNMDKRFFGKLAYNVAKCAKEDDGIAKKILKLASYELFLHIKAVAYKLDLSKNFTITAAGSIFKIKYVKENFERYIEKYFETEDIKIRYPEKPSYWGGFYYLKSIHTKGRGS